MTQDHYLTVRCTKDHVRRLDSLAQRAGMGRSQLIRRMLEALEVIPAKVSVAIEPRPDAAKEKQAV